MVRDLSNVFFILILIYVGIKLTLGIGGHDSKKTVGLVVVLALIINFSLFFSNVIYDSSNILASVFYNKINVESKDSAGIPRDYAAIINEKDVAGGMVQAFDPTKAMSSTFFNKQKNNG